MQNVTSFVTLCILGMPTDALSAGQPNLGEYHVVSGRWRFAA